MAGSVRVETLVYLIREDSVLLIEKKRGLGAGNLNGVGGKVERGETVEEAARREVKEEIGVIVGDLEWRGLLEFVNNGGAEYHYVHVFVSSDFMGEPKETDEAVPVWVKISEIPYDRMWEDDIFWLPLVLKGNKVFARFLFRDWKLVSGDVYTLKEGRASVLAWQGRTPL